MLNRAVLSTSDVRAAEKRGRSILFMVSGCGPVSTNSSTGERGVRPLLIANKALMGEKAVLSIVRFARFGGDLREDDDSAVSLRLR